MLSERSLITKGLKHIVAQLGSEHVSIWNVNLNTKKNVFQPNINLASKNFCSLFSPLQTYQNAAWDSYDISHYTSGLSRDDHRLINEPTNLQCTGSTRTRSLWSHITGPERTPTQSPPDPDQGGSRTAIPSWEHLFNTTQRLFYNKEKINCKMSTVIFFLSIYVCLE